MTRTKPKIVINGKFFRSQTTGAERYARQLVLGLDAIIQNQSVCLAVPPESDVSLSNIEVKPIGRKVGPAWEQIDLPSYVNRLSGSCISLTNTVPIFTHSAVATILDVRPFLSENVIGATSSVIRNTYNKLCMYYASKKVNTIITISNFTKNEIENVLSVPPEDIHVLYPSWEHMNAIDADLDALRRFNLEKGEFIFSLGSVMPHKNVQWTIHAAQNNPEEYFVVAGRVDSVIESKPSNMTLLGYITDEEAKALMQSCKIFLSPSLYEGFGMPPLEAIAAGCKCLLLADIPVYREVYGKSANYFNPLDYAYRVKEEYKIIDDIERNQLLSKYSVSNSTSELLRIIEASD